MSDLEVHVNTTDTEIMNRMSTGFENVDLRATNQERDHNNLSSRHSRELDSTRQRIDSVHVQLNSTAFESIDSLQLQAANQSARHGRDISSALANIDSIRSQLSGLSQRHGRDINSAVGSINSVRSQVNGLSNTLRSVNVYR